MDTIMLSTFCLYTYIGKPPKGAFTHKKENLPKTSFNKREKERENERERKEITTQDVT